MLGNVCRGGEEVCEATEELSFVIQAAKFLGFQEAAQGRVIQSVVAMQRLNGVGGGQLFEARG